MRTNIVVVGLGLTGFSCVKFFAQKGCQLRVTDTRTDPPYLAAMQHEFPNIPVHLGELSAEWLCDAEEVIVSPGVCVSHPAIQQALAKGVMVRGDIDVFAEYAQAPIVGITGSNGKTTVTTLLGHLGQFGDVRWIVGGNIGVPVLDLLDAPVPDAYILELSSFQLETIQKLFLQAATILNISPDHLDRYPSMDAYIAAKQRIYEHCHTAVYLRDATETEPQQKVAQKISFGLDSPAEGHLGVRRVADQPWLAFGEQLLLPLSEWPLFGSHNVLNAMAAAAIAHSLGLSWDVIGRGLRTFHGLPHRCQLVLKKNGVRWINDSKGTNVGATLAAIEGLAGDIQGKMIIILGGDGKGADFSVLAPPLQKYARAAVVFGQDADKLVKALDAVLPVYRLQNLEEVVKKCVELAEENDIVLLSPACSSLDMFSSYAARGEQFAQLAHKLF